MREALINLQKEQQQLEIEAQESSEFALSMGSGLFPTHVSLQNNVITFDDHIRIDTVDHEQAKETEIYQYRESPPAKKVHAKLPFEMDTDDEEEVSLFKPQRIEEDCSIAISKANPMTERSISPVKQGDFTHQDEHVAQKSPQKARREKRLSPEKQPKAFDNYYDKTEEQEINTQRVVCEPSSLMATQRTQIETNRTDKSRSRRGRQARSKGKVVKEKV